MGFEWGDIPKTKFATRNGTYFNKNIFELADKTLGLPGT